jgi:two-component system, OmpR family, alkaline phosphatase synthesis response regulator PhoP
MSTTKTILTVDDEAHILHVVSLKLKNAGFNVITANDAEEAFDSAMAAGGPSGTPAIDLVITDFQMPGMSGLDLARKLHAEPGKKNLPVMLLTAHGLALEQVELGQAGINVCLSKPFSPRDLLAKVNELLEKQEQTVAAATAAAATASA